MNEKVSIIILTKNRAQLLLKALGSIERQSFRSFEIIAVNDGSTDETAAVLESFKHLNMRVIPHSVSLGIIKSRQEAIEAATGKFVAFLDDDDQWIDSEKLKKQTSWFEKNPQGVLCGGGIEVRESLNAQTEIKNITFRPRTDQSIRRWMLLKNPFFTSTVMASREALVRAGGFVSRGADLGEDYDLWLRMGTLGRMYNFPEVFTAYAAPRYNKQKWRLFLEKQQSLIREHRKDYPFYWLGWMILKLRLFFSF